MNLRTSKRSTGKYQNVFQEDDFSDFFHFKRLGNYWHADNADFNRFTINKILFNLCGSTIRLHSICVICVPFVLAYFFSPNSINLSFKNSPAVILTYIFGCVASTQESKHVKSISERGCMKKGIEKREVPNFSLGGLKIGRAHV